MIELKRSINNKSFLICVLDIAITFALGYFLLVGIDKVKDISITQFQFSTYTVITQFGMMIYSIIVINSINQDYREKNILFFKKLKISPPIYLLKKIGVMMFWFSISILLFHSLTCVLYKDFSQFFVVLFYYLNATYYAIFIAAICDFLFKNILFAYGINLFLWLGGIVIAAIFPTMKYFGYFDASNQLYSNFEMYLNTQQYKYVFLREIATYNLVIFLLVILTCLFFSKRWIKNGI